LSIIHHFIANHPLLAYGFVFLVSLSESLALVGLLIPGTVIMFGIGAIVATGSLELYPVLLMAILGAITGDSISYWLGHHYHEQLKQFWPFSRFPGMLKKGEAFFYRHGGKSIFFGRFVGPVRPIIPIVAGMLGMKPLQFAVVNILSAIGWALAYTLPGVLFGSSLAVAGAISTRLAAFLLILVLVIWLFVWLCQKFYAILNERLPTYLTIIRRWCQEPTQSNLISQVKKGLLFFLQRRNGEEWLLFGLFLTVFFTILGFIWVMQGVINKDPIALTDQILYDFLQQLRTPFIDRIMVVITELGDSIINFSLFVVVLIMLLASRHFRAAKYWLISVSGGFISIFILKTIVHAPRPIAIYDGAFAFGFPSGHTTMSLILLGLPTLMMARELKGLQRWLLISVTSITILAIAFSRLYLGAHWFSDVLGGLFMGAIWVALPGLFYLRNVKQTLTTKPLSLSIFLCLVLVGSWHINRQFNTDLAKYAPQNNKPVMTISDWETGGWKKLPEWHRNISGDLVNPMTIQSIIPKTKLVKLLVQHGWEIPAPTDIKHFLSIFLPSPSLAELPVLPRWFFGQSDKIRLIKMKDGARWVLRLWQSPTWQVKHETLYIGTIEVEKRFAISKLMTLTKNTADFNLPINELNKMFHSLPDINLSVKKRNKTNLKAIENDYDTKIHWNNSVLLLKNKE
jgi:undecaprenyl-diphosphatase